jgi:zinc D-Ala-D-Ala carboxypeptidase
MATGAHFTDKELGCKCGCGRNETTQALVDALDELHELAGRAVIIHDAYRCPKHNNETPGAVANSEHPRGEAADLHIPGLGLAELYRLADKVPAFANGGIGVYDTAQPMIHVDVRGHRARWARVRGRYVGIAQLLPGVK